MMLRKQLDCRARPELFETHAATYQHPLRTYKHVTYTRNTPTNVDTYTHAHLLAIKPSHATTHIHTVILSSSEIRISLMWELITTVATINNTSLCEVMNL